MQGIGASPYFNVAVTNTPVALRAVSSRLYYVHAINTALTDVFLQMFDVPAASVVAGTTVPVQSWLLPGGTGASNRGAFEQAFPFPIQFNGAMSMLVATTAAGGTAPGSAAIVNLGIL
jgi:hypothetical protein